MIWWMSCSCGWVGDPEQSYEKCEACEDKNLTRDEGDADTYAAKARGWEMKLRRWGRSLKGLKA